MNVVMADVLGGDHGRTVFLLGLVEGETEARSRWHHPGRGRTIQIGHSSDRARWIGVRKATGELGLSKRHPEHLGQIVRKHKGCLSGIEQPDSVASPHDQDEPFPIFRYTKALIRILY